MVTRWCSSVCSVQMDTDWNKKFYILINIKIDQYGKVDGDDLRPALVPQHVAMVKLLRSLAEVIKDLRATTNQSGAENEEKQREKDLSTTDL